MRSSLIPLRFQLTFGLTLLAASCLTAHAEVLADYSFTDGSLLSADTNLDSAASPFSAGGGILGTSTSFDKGWAQVGGDQLTNHYVTLADAIVADDYFTFTLTPQSGFTLNLTQLTLNIAAYRANGASTSIQGHFFVLSNVDGFTSAGSISSTSAIQQNSPFAFTSFDVNLADARFQGLAGPVEFRIYMHYNTQDASRFVAIDNVTLTGTLSSNIPEPTTYASIIGACGLALAAGCRRRS